MTRDASIVYATSGAILLKPPGTIVFHREGRSEWPSWPGNPDKPGTAMMVGHERHWTRCGLQTYDDRAPRMRMEAMRRDNAVLIGRPCRKCWRKGA